MGRMTWLAVHKAGLWFRQSFKILQRSSEDVDKLERAQHPAVRNKKIREMAVKTRQIQINTEMFVAVVSGHRGSLLPAVNWIRLRCQ